MPPHRVMVVGGHDAEWAVEDPMPRESRASVLTQSTAVSELLMAFAASVFGV